MCDQWSVKVPRRIGFERTEPSASDRLADRNSEQPARLACPGMAEQARCESRPTHTPIPRSRPPAAKGSQFFITYAPAPNLDGHFTVFAQVTQGVDVVQNLTPRDPS